MIQIKGNIVCLAHELGEEQAGLFKATTLRGCEVLAMNKSQMIILYDQDQRKNVEYPEMEQEVTPNVERHIPTALNCRLISGLIFE